MPVGSTNVLPFYFGSAGRQLFGCYHQPRSSGARTCGIVICQPILHEYIYSHRALRQLATRLCDAGFPVLRFDYYGCGDSSGIDEDGSMQQWLQDISEAVTELRLRAQVSRICLIGLRFGATLATMTVVERDDIDSLVLWEPILSGQIYLRELSALQKEALRLRPRPARRADRQTQFEVIGFPLSQTLYNELEGLDLSAVPQTSAKRILALQTDQARTGDSLATHLRQNGDSIDVQHIPAPSIWLPTTDGSLHVPGQVVQSLVAWSCQTCA